MTFIEYAQKMYPNQKLSQSQKDLLLNCQKAKAENKTLFVSFGRNYGITMIMNIINNCNNTNAEINNQQK